MILGLLFEVPSWQSSLCKQCWASLPGRVPGRVSLNKCIIDRNAFLQGVSATVRLLLCSRSVATAIIQLCLPEEFQVYLLICPRRVKFGIRDAKLGDGEGSHGSHGSP